MLQRMYLSATTITPLIARWDSFFNASSCTYNYKASALPLAQEFGLVTPNPFSSLELGGP